MTTTPLDPRTRVLDAAKDAVAARMSADVALLVAATDWALMHPATEVTGYAGFGHDLLFGEALVPLAGAGAPLVAEFAPAELAASLGWSTETVKVLMGDARPALPTPPPGEDPRPAGATDACPTAATWTTRAGRTIDVPRPRHR